MRILLLHQNFPGQFRHLAHAWSRRPDCEVVGLGRDTAPGMPGVRWYTYRLHRPPGQAQHPYLRQMESAVLHGQAVARALQRLRQRGFIPDVVIAHPGWGETLYLRDVFPHARLIHLCEWYYGATGTDAGFDPEFPATADDFARMRTWNALHALNLTHCDAGVSPTAWQRSRHPAAFQPAIQVIHEGIETPLLRPDPAATLTTPSGTVLKAGDPVITYVARNLEPYRGFHRFMRALQTVQRRHRTCHAVIVGGDDVSYGERPPDAPNWREKMLREVTLDPARTHFTGRLPHAEYRKVLQVSAAHVYLTYPFVLSWSLLEAMASGCLIIGSRTAPVEEVIRDGENGVLVDFFDTEGLAERICEALEGGERYAAVRRVARETVSRRYAVDRGLAGYAELVGMQAQEVCLAD
ncbi:glycosyltransferase family 4 protein [Pseudothauera rhizosphaerae]|uniref:Glycosyltransferase n=1 Tax=Pseudothauera rhizosphaerae TaxID=2565932 RepID=A0A4S4A936_9RHOO|nr:glycosyltransferase family 4 protein [Pseudothauera rhizosphaerae]THF55362.1 glycosyltransferase [Pseudothauera rhizosphaerae]